MYKIYGMGINDAVYSVYTKNADGKRNYCPYYLVWRSMISRCYNNNVHKKYPSYKGCSVTKEWLNFMKFKGWMEQQDWEDKQLDKDTLLPMNKIYSPETCVFISQSLNKLLTDHKAGRGKWPIGVNWDKSNNKFKSQININGIRTHLGLFNHPWDAHLKWRLKKASLIRLVAYESTDPRVKKGLYKHANLIELRGTYG